ncbi:MAG: DNA repair protein RadC [Clostridia bacterium]|nr:DNA repair protein RadC [Clostridia bacterium]
MTLRSTLPGIPECDRPYEKLELHGASSLTDSELLAVILRAGTKEQNVLDIARELLLSFDGKLKNLCRAGIKELTSVSGIGRVKAIQLMAAGELALRIERDIRAPASRGGGMEGIAEYLVEKLWNETTEVFMVLMLDKRLRITGSRVVSRGTLDYTVVHPREVFAPAIRELAYAVVVAHNHPSGDTYPSREDLEITSKLKKAGEILGIQLLDHIIVGKKNYSSLKKLGFIDSLKK